MTKKKIVNKTLTLGLCATLVIGQVPTAALAEGASENAQVAAESGAVEERASSEDDDVVRDGVAPEGTGDVSQDGGGNESASAAGPAEVGASEPAPDAASGESSEAGAEEENPAGEPDGAQGGQSETAGGGSGIVPVDVETGGADTGLEDPADTGDAFEADTLEVVSENASDSAEVAPGEPELVWISAEDELELSNDELFAGYVEQTLYEPLYGDIALYGNFGESQLNTLERFFYRQAKDLIARVAAGQEDMALTTFSIDDRTPAELGKPYSQLTAQDIRDALEQVFRSLLIDCPYELYWFDKTAGMASGYADKTGRLVGDVSLGFKVANAYKGFDTSEYAAFSVNTGITSAASQTVARAQAVVSQYAALSDYEKIVAYKNWICGQVSYNSSAAHGGAAYGDPWQVIYVFDNNSNTNVVCEGYAKAFQYLCDLSSFKSASTQCYLVDGLMGNEAHMWNIVTLAGANGTANYLADLTNSDDGATGVFLNGAMSGSIATGYSFKYYTGRTLTYRYDDDQKALYGSGASSVLNLSSQDYAPSTTTPVDPSKPGTDPSKPGTDPVEPTPGEDDPIYAETLLSSNPDSATLVYGYAAALAPTLSVKASNYNSQPSYQWYCDGKAISGATKATYQIPGSLHSGTYTYYCMVTWPGNSKVEKETRMSVITRLTVQKRPLTIVPTAGQWKYSTENDPHLSYSFGATSLVKGDKLSGSLSRKSGDKVGRYAINLGTLTHKDYELKLAGTPTFEVRSPWVQQGGAWKCTQSNGGYAKGWVKEGSVYYYCDSQGRMQTGWQKIGGIWYYFNNSGVMATGWTSVGGTWYYFNASGAMKTGWLNLDGTWYYLSGSGAMWTGWLKLGSTWYYFNGSGVMTQGWQNIGGIWYYFNESGAMKTGWQQIGSSWYYLNSSGAMLTNWQRIGGTWYYFYSSGVMAANTTVGGYKLSASGAMV